jgi:hypothetical protein
MGTVRRGAVAAPLPDGRVLVAGSYYDGGDHYLSSAEVFNPATSAFTPVGDMGIARVRAAAAPLPDGRVLVAGGNEGPRVYRALRSSTPPPTRSARRV